MKELAWGQDAKQPKGELDGEDDEPGKEGLKKTHQLQWWGCRCLSGEGQRYGDSADTRRRMLPIMSSLKTKRILQRIFLPRL